uniref:SprT-like domain-containing protein n=1 Tax=Globodera pallida TaxID=36090 RepID=A0A183CFQ2_GLOPA
MAGHKNPWRKFVSTIAHETIHCAALTVGSTPGMLPRCGAMCAADKKTISPEFKRFCDEVACVFPFLAAYLDIFE